MIYRLDRNGVYVKPDNYDLILSTKYFNDDNSYTKTAGYVNPIDITTQLVSYDDILNPIVIPSLQVVIFGQLMIRINRLGEYIKLF